jgi:hypothetical protein
MAMTKFSTASDGRLMQQLRDISRRGIEKIADPGLISWAIYMG